MKPASHKVMTSQWQSFLGETGETDTVSALVAASVLRQYARGETLIAQSGRDNDVMLILSGAVRVVRLTPNGQEIWLAEMAPGDMVGETAPLIDEPRNSVVMAIEAAEAASIEAPVFNRLMRVHPHLAYRVAQTLAKRLKRTSDDLVEQVSLNVSNRLHACLYLMGVADENGVVSLRSVPQVSELATRIHATREATSRALSRLKSKELVTVEKKVWHVSLPNWLRDARGDNT